MSCRDIHATNAFAFIIAILSVGGITVAALIPQWRITKLVTFNRNAKNISVYDGLWAKCVMQDGYSGCLYYDSEVLLDLFCLCFVLFFNSQAFIIVPALIIYYYVSSGTPSWISWICGFCSSAFPQASGSAF